MTFQRIGAFIDPIFAGLAASIFETRALDMDMGLDLYCLLPDHVHLLLQVKTCGLIDYIQDVKSRTTKEWWLNGQSGHLWQRSFHDRGLRNPVDYEQATSYILHNPVLAGLSNDWEGHPTFGGTLVRPLGQT